MEQQRQIKLRNLIAYGFGDFYGGGSFFLVSTFAMYYLITVVGLSPLMAGLVPGLGKVWDAVSDPIMGYITDHTKSRHGRRRVFFLVAIVPILVSFILLWVPVHFSSQLATFLYYFTAYLFFYTVFTMTMVPYSALSAEMSQDFRERNRLTGARMIFSITGTLVGAVAVQPIIDAFPNPEQGHLVMGIVFGVLYAIPWIFVYRGTWELPVTHVDDDKRFFRNFLSMFKNRTFIVHLGMYICAYTALDVFMGWFKFYFIDYLGRADLINWGMGTIIIVEFCFVPVYVAISNRWGHARAYLVGLVLWAAGTGLLYLQAPGNPVPLLILNCVVVGMGLSAGVIIPWTMLPFLTDVDELITMKKRAGIYAGSMTLVRKLIQGAVVIPLIGVFLTVIGYRSAPQDELALAKLSRQVQGTVQKASKEEGLPATAWDLKLGRMMEQVDRAVLGIADAGLRGRIDGSARLLRQAYDGYRMAGSDGERREGLSAIDAGAVELAKGLQFSQSPEAVQGLRHLFIIMPLVFLFLGILVSFKFRINRQTHAVLMAEIERLKGGGRREDVEPETRRICEELTGQSYDTLYRSER